MKTRLSLLSVVLITCLVAGCAGGGLFFFAAKLLGIGYAAGQINDWLGKDADEFRVHINGYDLGIKPNPSGALNLNGLPVGEHLLSIVSTDNKVGWHRTVTIQENVPVNLGTINPIQGGVIAGKVERETGAGRAPAAGVRVVAIKDAANLLAPGGNPISVPPAAGVVGVMAFTDAQGNYRLGPCEFGQWLVSVAEPGFLADVAVAPVQSGQDAPGRNLYLRRDPNPPAPGTISGTVVRDGGGSLGRALVNIDLGTPFRPPVEAVSRAAVESQVGASLIDGPWFAWRTLAAETTAAGAYNLRCRTGTHNVWGFAWGYKAKTGTVTVSSNAVAGIDFALPVR